MVVYPGYYQALNRARARAIFNVSRAIFPPPVGAVILRDSCKFGSHIPARIDSGPPPPPCSVGGVRPRYQRPARSPGLGFHFNRPPDLKRNTRSRDTEASGYVSLRHAVLPATTTCPCHYRMGIGTPGSWDPCQPPPGRPAGMFFPAPYPEAAARRSPVPGAAPRSRAGGLPPSSLPPRVVFFCIPGRSRSTARPEKLARSERSQPVAFLSVDYPLPHLRFGLAPLLTNTARSTAP